MIRKKLSKDHAALQASTQQLEQEYFRSKALLSKLDLKLIKILKLHKEDPMAAGYCDQCQSNYPCATREIINGSYEGDQ